MKVSLMLTVEENLHKLLCEEIQAVHVLEEAICDYLIASPPPPYIGYLSVDGYPCICM